MKTMNSVKVNTDKIKGFMSMHKMSKIAFSKFCGVNAVTLHKILSGDGFYKLENLLQISTALDVPITELFN